MKNVLFTLSLILLLSCNALVVHADGDDDDLGNSVFLFKAIDEKDEWLYESYVVDPPDDLKMYFMDEYNPNNCDSNYSVGVLFKSDSVTQVTIRFRQYVYKKGAIVRKVNDKTFSIDVKSIYSGNFVDDEMSNYYKIYVKQFMKDDTYDDYKDYFENHTYYFGYWQFDDDLKAKTIDTYSFYPGDLPSLSVYSLRTDGTKYADAISTNMVGYYISLNYHFLTYYAPFWYVPKDEDKPPYLPDDSDSEGGQNIATKKFVVYRECVAYANANIENGNWYDGTTIGVTYKNNFTWDVEKYPDFQNCKIEVRACPFTQWLANKNQGSVIDWYYFCSPDVNKAKSVQKDMPIVNFTDGLAVGYRLTLDKYYYNWLQRFADSIANGRSKDYVWQVRAVSDDGVTTVTDWCTFTNDALGTSIGMSDVFVSDSGEIGEPISNDINYDSNKVPSGTKLDDSANTSDNDYNYSDNGVNMKEFVSWLKNISDAIGEFPRLLAKIYQWLPDQLITAITVTMSFIIVLRVLGR